MNKAWITGTGGLIGSHLLRRAHSLAPGWRIVALNRKILDLTDFSAVTRQFAEDSPSLLIHCAAISNSSQCEKSPELAQLVNVEVTRRLAALFAGRRMVFFSTDLVFDGQRGNYVETDPTAPLGVYAQTKVNAEEIVLAHPRNLVIRTSLNGGTSPAGNRGFNEALQIAWKEGVTTPLFVDEFRCPIPATVTARATWELVLAEAEGIYHLCGSQRLSRWQIGQQIAARHPELTPQIKAASLIDYGGPPRAPDCSLNCSRAQAQLSFALPGLSDWLAARPSEPW